MTRIICHGIDLADCRRIQQPMDRHGSRFLDRVFTPAEQSYCCKHRLPAERLAARFAVKEAVMKMLGTGWRNGVAWTDIETTNTLGGAPQVRLSGRTAQIALQRGIQQISLSITHARDLAVASVVALGTSQP